MKLKFNFLITDMGEDGFAAVAVGEDAAKFHGMLKLNDVSAVIMERLKEETSFDSVMAYLKEKYPESEESEISEKLAGFLDEISNMGLLITDGNEEK